MGFIGPVNRFGDAFVRPHDIEITLTANGTTREANVAARSSTSASRCASSSCFPDGTNFWAQVTRREVEQLALDEGARVYVKPSRERVFAEAG